MNRMRMCLCLVSLCMLVIPAMSFGQVQQLPINAYLDEIGDNAYYEYYWDADGTYLMFDVYGKQAQDYGLDVGTTVDGKVTIRELANGRAHVSILIHTNNAICWGYQFDGEDYPWAFGYEPWDVADGVGAASLGEATIKREFTIEHPNDPLLNFDNDESVSAVVNCRGELRYGSGFPDGTPGRAHTTQKGLFLNEIPKNCPAGDCWPVENVFFKPVGK
jgi:hypothetical protein